MGIHYDYKSTRREKTILRQAKREARLAAKKARRKDDIDSEQSNSAEPVMHDIQKTITLDDLTNPDNKK